VDFYELLLQQKDRSFSLFLGYGAQVSDIEDSERLECEEADARSSVQTQQVGQKLCFG
jgi:hypothetical protein